jgi:predicted amidohydrolase YtcJ
VRSFKFYADGALGSRGACLLQPYADKANWHGFLLNTPAHFTKYAALMAEKGFQMNTHCIGDSAVRFILKLYGKYTNKKSEAPLRWRIEHAQVLDPADFKLFSETGSIPSVQPTHATSDMYWATDRLGHNRVKYAYAYKKLLESAGTIALGTDFPVEGLSPFKTFYAAIARKDSQGVPANGFQIENKLSRVEALKGMTIWAAYANFEENEKGSLEVGKDADFVILDQDLMNCYPSAILKTTVLKTFIAGEQVFSKP